jgi:hypothetical protein
MSKNAKMYEKVEKLRKKVENQEVISTFAQLVAWEADNVGSMKRPKIAKPFLKKLQESGFYLDL